MHAIDDNPFKLEWQAWGQRLAEQYPTPSAILLISAHWQTAGWQVTSAAQPRTIHDFGGFPAELFAQQYPAPGAPELLAQIQALAPSLAATSDGGAWGLDHGAWAPLMHLFPKAQVPVAQLSLNTRASLAQHYAAGQALQALRQQGVLIIGSGNTVHNFGLMHAPKNHPIWQAVDAFDALVATATSQGNHRPLVEFSDDSLPLLQAAHPSLEHYLPLLYAAGAGGTAAATQILAGSYPQAPVGMRCLQWH